MCGIIAFIGSTSTPVYSYIMFGLKMLQNRGYDSAGVCAIDSNNNFILRKYANTSQINSITQLELDAQEFSDAITAIGHSRWATHGGQTDANSHPHIDYTNKFALVHNGIIENYAELKQELKNISFKSQTDSEVIVNLIGYYYTQTNNIAESISKALSRLHGTWGLVIIALDTPDVMYCARHGSPLLIGYSDDAYMIISSEQSGFCKYVNNYICLNDNDLVAITRVKDKVHCEQLTKYQIREVTAEIGDLSPAPFQHWTIKEIYDQPDAVMRAIGNGGRLLDDARVKLGGLDMHTAELLGLDNLILLGCGTSYHAGMHALSTLKQISGFNTVTLYDGAEFASYDLPSYKQYKTGLLLISQSGETKDLHRCLQMAKENDLFTIGVINTVDSLIARDVNCGVYLNAGREVAVASTKSFTSQVVVLNLIAIWFAQHRNIHLTKRRQIIASMRRLPIDIQTALETSRSLCRNIAQTLLNTNQLFVLGKASAEAIAHESALKIKEITYTYAEAYSSGALKHGPLALLTSDVPVIFIVPDDEHVTRNQNAIAEVAARGSPIIIITTSSDKYHHQTVKLDHNGMFDSLIAIIPMQLLAYELALARGINMDQPRNLAKCVTTD